MKRIPLLVLSIVFLSLVAVATVFAQTGESTPLNDNNASISIIQTLPITASVDVEINGQIYKLAIPVTVNIDTQKDLADALLTAQSIDRVGDLQWKITEITETEEAFEVDQSSPVEPSSPNHKLIIVTSELTNLGSEPFAYRKAVSELFAYDNLGNLFDPSDYSCDDINPGDSMSCAIVFDVPKTVLILGLDMKVTDHKRIPFSSPD